jgi:hypothetical protein
MSDSDRYLFESSVKATSGLTPAPVMASAPRVINVADTNNGTYSSSQIMFNLPGLVTAEGYQSLANSWIEIPYVVHVRTSHELEVGSIPVCLKAEFASLINSYQITFNDQGVQNEVANTNVYNHFRMLTRDANPQFLTNEADNRGFYKDTATSADWSATAGVGEVNNNPFPDEAPAANAITLDMWGASTVSNEGLRKRMKALCRPIDVDAGGTPLNVQDATNRMMKFVGPEALRSSRMNVLTRVRTASTVLGNGANNGQFDTTLHCYAQIQLKDLDEMFSEDKIQLLHGLNLRLVLFVNTATATLNYVARAAQWDAAATVNGGITPVFQPTTSSVSSKYGQCPFIVLPHGKGWSFAKCDRAKAADNSDPTAVRYPSGNLTLTITSGIVSAGTVKNFYNETACIYKAVFVSLEPRLAAKYIESLSNKSFTFNKLYMTSQQYDPKNNGGFSAQQRLNVSTGITKPRFLLVHTRSAGADQFAGDAMLSPFTSSPFTVSPFIQFTEINVQMSGSPIYSTRSLEYSYDIYREQLRQIGYNDPAGNFSGIISKSDWESGCYGFLWFDLSRTDDATDQSSRTVDLYFKYASTKTFILTAILGHEHKLTINTDTAKLSI